MSALLLVGGASAQGIAADSEAQALGGSVQELVTAVLSSPPLEERGVDLAITSLVGVSTTGEWLYLLPPGAEIECVGPVPAEAIRLSDGDPWAGKITIQSADDALAFVRIRSSPATLRARYGTDSEGLLEPIPVSQLDSGWLLNRASWYAWVWDAQRGEHDPATLVGRLREWVAEGRRPTGVLSEAEWERLGLPGPHVRRIGSSFVVLRWVLVCVPDQPHYGPTYRTRLERIRELVGPGGHYLRKTLYRRQLHHGDLQITVGW
jgi:hypothetical protein